ncbi:hypothetical protein K1719_029462 [Acacia pycnantha]|nr:hypothetical protein K1719_029462 [Acacia pycnantha]
MDSREPPQSSPPSRSQQRHSSASPPNIMMPPGFPAAVPNPITSSLINPNSSSTGMAPATARYPFLTFASHSRSTPPPAPPLPSPPSKPSEPLRTTTSPYEGSSALGPVDSPKKKRGRARKYSPDGSTTLGLGPTPLSSSAPADLSPTSDEPPAKKSRGRPPGPGKKQLDALGGGGTFFTPHVILVKTGEDIAAKITSFCEDGSRLVCILSAHGAVSNATLRQSATSGGTAYYEGRYQILCLSGSFNPSEEGGCRTGGMSVALSGTDGRTVGGSVSGMLVAASEIQVIVSSFIVGGKKKSNPKEKSGSSPAAMPSGTQVLSATSQGVSSNSSDEDDDSSLQRGSGSGTGNGTGSAYGSGNGTGTGPGFYSGFGQPVDNMQWNQRWRPQR